MKITHFGHACLLVETGSARLLFDPGTDSSGYEGLTGLTAVLITHSHADHFDTEALPALFAANRGAILIADEETAAAVAEFTPRVAHPGDVFELAGSTVAVSGGTHASIYLDFPGSGNVAYSVDGDAFFHPGDSFTLPEGGVDVLALPISGPWLKLGEVAEYLVEIAPRIAIPMHEAALAKVQGAHAMLGMFAPDGTEVLPLERGVETEV